MVRSVAAGAEAAGSGTAVAAGWARPSATTSSAATIGSVRKAT
jgi:hypothetical protein